MNIVTANRLLDLRKENNLSQEALAEKLGISRQAISKWERAEASPDTDNLIALAKLYGLSLDDLLGMEPSAITKVEETENPGGGSEEPSKYVHLGSGGIHVKDKDAEVHLGWHGIHVSDKNDKVDISKEGLFINDEKFNKEGWYHNHEWRSAILGFPFVLLVLAAYVVMGIFLDAWHPGWIVFLLIPLWYTFIEAVYKKNANVFAYPVLVAMAFLLLGFYKDAWHPAWALFLTVPIYYGIVNFIRAIRKK